MYACGKKSLLKNERDRLVSLSEIFIFLEPENRQVPKNKTYRNQYSPDISQFNPDSTAAQ